MLAKARQRTIGIYDEGNEGALLFVFGGMHGNEPAGVRALEEIFRMLEREPLANPSFRFNGRLVGLLGNMRAFGKRERFLDKDLNRQFTHENIARIRAEQSDGALDSEDLEILDLLDTIEAEIADYNPRKIVFLDLHTTTAFGGIFSIATDDPESLRIAVELHAPVICKLIDGIQGTTLHYFNKENFGRDTVSVTFESGQHDEELSINRAIAAITNCLRSIGCVDANDVENRHDRILIEYSKNLPQVANLLYCHSIRPDDQFRMRPGYKNFQPVRKGEALADDENGEIRSEYDGLILMPLYQKQGNDGFFIIHPVEAL